MRYLLSIGFLFHVYCSYAQLSGEVLYEVTLKNIYEGKENHNPKVVDFYKEIMFEARRIDLKLVFSERASMFESQKGLPLGDKTMLYNFAKNIVCPGIYYTNIADHFKLRQEESGGKLFLLTIEEDSLEWKYDKSTKRINGYVCHKAIATKVINNPLSGRVKKINIIAWYTRDIPFSYGPLEYGAFLPGLILELENGFAVYTARDIKLNTNKRITIDIPKKGEKMTEKEYKALYVDRMKNMF